MGMQYIPDDFVKGWAGGPRVIRRCNLNPAQVTWLVAGERSGPPVIIAVAHVDYVEVFVECRNETRARLLVSLDVGGSSDLPFDFLDDPVREDRVVLDVGIAAERTLQDVVDHLVAGRLVTALMIHEDGPISYVGLET